MEAQNMSRQDKITAIFGIGLNVLVVSIVILVATNFFA